MPHVGGDRPFIEEGQREHNPLEVAGRTAQLLLMGSAIAIMGLLFSFVMVLFRVTCDSKFKMATWMAVNGTREVCKTSPNLRPVLAERLEHRHLDGIVSDVTWAPCRSNEDCAEFSRGFCAGGPDQIAVQDWCTNTSNECTCKAVIWDCGYAQDFEFTIAVGEVVHDCHSLFCGENITMTIPKWTLHRSNFIGCESKHKTNIWEAMADIQARVQLNGVTHPLKDSNDEVWDELKGYLALTADLDYNFFWPSTISESVASQMSPEQKIFVGFMLCAALAMFRSDYTSECHTVDLPHKPIPFIQIEWNTARAWLPPIGLILLSFVEMVPTSEIYDMPHGLMTAVHLVGAQFCFVVYLGAEAAALLDHHNREEMKQAGELVARAALCITGAVSMGIFGVSYATLAVFSGKGVNPYVRQPLGGFSDMYERNSVAAQSFLVRPASGFWRTLKMVSYLAEFTVALTILLNMFAIWVFFQQRLNKLHALQDAGLQELDPEGYDAAVDLLLGPDA